MPLLSGKLSASRSDLCYAYRTPHEFAMINNLSILFSLAMVCYVMVRAATLDARRPWFEAAKPDDARPDPAPHPSGNRQPTARRR